MQWRATRGEPGINGTGVPHVCREATAAAARRFQTIRLPCEPARLGQRLEPPAPRSHPHRPQHHRLGLALVLTSLSAVMPPFQPELISRLQHPHASPAVASPSPSVKPGDAEACSTLNVNTPPQSRSASSTTGSAPGGVSGSTSACGYSVRLDGALSPSVSRADPVALAVSDDVAGSYASSIHASLDPADTRSNALDLLRSVSRKTKQAEDTLVAQRGLLGKSKASADVQSPWLPSLAFRQPAPLPQAAGTAPSHSCEPQEDHPESSTFSASGSVPQVDAQRAMQSHHMMPLRYG